MSSQSVSSRASVLLPALLVLLFGVFLHQIEMVALICLAAAIILIAYQIRNIPYPDFRELFGLYPSRAFWIIVGAVSAGVLATWLRWNQTHTLYPWPLSSFLWLAMLIGVTEEVLFRGYFFGELLRWKGPAAAVTGSALLHAAYKTSLFISSSPSNELLFLGGVTFAAGLLVGFWRKVSASLWPCVVAHAMFDLWVYGDRTTPWWIW